jgi:hypothetical protein
MPATTANRTFAAGQLGFELGGAFAGYVNSAEGGYAVGDVVTEKLGPDHIAHKHIAGVRYEDISLACGTGMSKPFYEWVKSAFGSQHDRKDLAIKTADYDGNVKSEMDVFHGLLTEIGFPALDASSKGAATLTLKISPEYTRQKKGSGKLSMIAKRGPKWLAANFRLAIPGLDCTHVSQIDALTWTERVTENTAAVIRDYEKEPAVLEAPNLVVTLSEAAAESFIDWHQSFVIDGKHDQAQEKTGTLDFLTQDLKQSLFTLKFHGLGIFRLTPDKTEAGSEQVQRVKAEMYCESAEFSYGAGAIGA